jgi:hypothetical protein
MISIQIPDGFETTAFFSRICSSGLCSWADIKSARYDILGVYEMALMIDWREMCETKARLR